MEIVFILLLIVIAIAAYCFGKGNANLKVKSKNEYVEKINRKLEADYQEHLNNIEKIKQRIAEEENNYNTRITNLKTEYESKITDLTTHYKTTEAAILLKEAHLCSKLDDIKDNKFSKINEAATQYRKKLHTEITKEIELETKNHEERKHLLDQEYKSLQNSVAELQASRDALIEANKREEEIRLQQDFYKIQLSTDDFEDIKLLKTIERHLHNKESLYKLIWSTFFMVPSKEMLNRIIGKEKSSGIYKITNQLNGKVYIGQSVDLHTRLTNHIKASLGITGTIAHQLVHDAMSTDGLENFTFEIVEKCNKEQLNKKEKLWIETYSADKYGYNRTAGGAKEVK